MTSPPTKASAAKSFFPHAAFSCLFGSVLGLALLKFGNPVILEHLIERPTSLPELLFQPWPLIWGYGLLIPVVLAGFVIASFDVRPVPFLVWTPLLWLGWQCVAAFSTVDARLTRVTLPHFAACTLCFYLGFFALSRARRQIWFWTPILCAFGYVLMMGFDQHYGGLEATRAEFYKLPDWRQYPPDYIKKIESNRVFSTLVYPNALADAIILYLPILAWTLWSLLTRRSAVARGVIAGTFAYAAVACLFWSGSKSGWLILLTLLLVLVFQRPFPRRIKVAIVGCLIVFGLAGFFIKFRTYFQRGAPSVGARFDYWSAAWKTAKTHPVRGTGPGTFSVPYSQLKAPQSEMAKLTHNDYLEQASDSGFPGFVLYFTFIIGSAVTLYRNSAINPFLRIVWLGLLGWTLGAFVEFELYIPALSWPAFTLFGYLFAHSGNHGSKLEKAHL